MDSENIFEKFKLPAQLNGDSTKNFDKKRNRWGLFVRIKNGAGRVTCDVKVFVQQGKNGTTM
jgi:hypothetical protein